MFFSNFLREEAVNTNEEITIAYAEKKSVEVISNLRALEEHLLRAAELYDIINFKEREVN